MEDRQQNIPAAPPHEEYPRPQLVRNSYLNLNGRWQYAITDSDTPPAAWDGEILVPFCPESRLSGVERVLLPGQYLWYRRSVLLPPGFIKSNVLLNFGAVDQSCEVYLNGQLAGRHSGGYLPFTFDVTNLLQDGRQELMLRVSDPTDTAPFPYGRQRLNGESPWHTPVSGIWQTVWMESVPERYIKNLRITPVYDESAVVIAVESRGGRLSGTLEIYAKATRVAGVPFQSGVPVQIKLPGALSWTPQTPFLYTLKVLCEDPVESYFGMRKISLGTGEDGHTRIFLNNRPFVCAGVLDKGLYPNGIYTPADEGEQLRGLRFAKAAGFNTIRKNAKLEALRWYYHCDRMGFLVWQDLPGGGQGLKPSFTEKLVGYKNKRDDTKYALFGRESEEGRTAFEGMMVGMVSLLHNAPCLGVWVLFQNGQGQYDAAALAKRMRALDAQRLVDHASGRFDQGGGDIASLHIYAKDPPPGSWGTKRAAVITEAGGYGLAEAAQKETPKLRAAQMCQNQKEYAEALVSLYSRVLAPAVQQGASGFIVAQLADVQTEVCGLLSGDGRWQKINPQGLATLNRTVLALAAARPSK